MSLGLACFDLDGCLADSSVAIPHTINLALQEAGLPTLPAALLRRYIGPPLLQSFEEMLRDAGDDPARAAACLDSYRSHYPRVSIERTTAYPGIPELLAGLSPKARLVVVTSKPAAFSAPLVEALGLARYFEALHAPELDETLEPKEVTLGRALEQAGRVEGERAMIGDRHHDVDAGRAWGLRTAGVLWGFGSREELEHAGAELIAAEPPGLAHWLDSL